MDGPKGKEVINRVQPDQIVRIGVTLLQKTRQALIELLKKYKHVFSWTPTDMVGIDRGIIEHKLMIRYKTKEIKQKKRV